MTIALMVRDGARCVRRPPLILPIYNGPARQHEHPKNTYAPGVQQAAQHADIVTAWRDSRPSQRTTTASKIHKDATGSRIHTEPATVNWPSSKRIDGPQRYSAPSRRRHPSTEHASDRDGAVIKWTLGQKRDHTHQIERAEVSAPRSQSTATEPPGCQLSCSTHKVYPRSRLRKGTD